MGGNTTMVGRKGWAVNRNGALVGAPSLFVGEGKRFVSLVVGEERALREGLGECLARLCGRRSPDKGSDSSLFILAASQRAA